MPVTVKHPIHAAGSVAADGTVVAGCRTVTPAKTAVGKYTLTLQEALDALQGVALITPRTADDDCAFGFVWTSDTVLTVEAWKVGLAADVAFDFAILNLVQ